MIEIVVTPSLDHKLRKVDNQLLVEILDVIERLRDRINHQQLKIHKLHGKLKDRYAVSIDYRHRLIFRWMTKNRILLVDFGDHSVYE